MTGIPRPEHPRPQFQRASWLNLNGTWSFAFDPGKSGEERGLAGSHGFERSLTVPFCPESALSGVGHTDFIEAMWYHREVTLPADWAGHRTLLHCGGIDYESEVYVDGRSAGLHVGGSASFTHDLTPFVTPGQTHHLVIRVRDEPRPGGRQPGGKQSTRYHSHGCHYTRVTGIWQTVWLEAAPTCGLRDVQITPDWPGRRFLLTPRFWQEGAGLTWRARLADGCDTLAEGTASARQGSVIALGDEALRPWSPRDPQLYDLELAVLGPDGAVLDRVSSYAGLREVRIEGDRVLLNDEPLYQRLVLDQGFYPDGIWTAPTDEALRRDILLSQQAGFNGARLHQKVFEERFHYWADRLGYLTWGEFASWGCDPNSTEGARNFLSEWAEVLVRDRNHPSIVAWTPWNETRHVSDPHQHRRTHEDCVKLCRSLDPTRPVNDASGYVHHQTDLWTVHNYEQDPAKLAAMLTPSPETGVWRNYPDLEPPYRGQPYLVDEFGGSKWVPQDHQAWAGGSWGYGQAPADLEELYARLAAQVQAILAQPHISGYCYTQLTDVEQEQNGIYCYDRSPKFDLARIAAIFTRQPDGWGA